MIPQKSKEIIHGLQNRNLPQSYCTWKFCLQKLQIELMTKGSPDRVQLPPGAGLTLTAGNVN